jgi:predicted oxidoreductase
VIVASGGIGANHELVRMNWEASALSGVRYSPTHLRDILKLRHRRREGSQFHNWERRLPDTGVLNTSTFSDLGSPP